MLVFSTDEREDRGYLLDALEQGSLTRERLAQAVTRILALKAVSARPPRDSHLLTQKVGRKACAEGR
jgi:beta-N-acetylhexosaminidase